MGDKPEPLIERIVLAVCKVEHRAYQELGRKPMLAIYIDQETLTEIRHNTRGAVSSYVMEYLEHGTIHGHPVFTVTGSGHGWRVYVAPTNR